MALLHGARRAKLRGEPELGQEPDIAELSVDASEFGAKWQNDSESTAAFRRAVVRLTVAIACLTGVFAALNAGLTTSHAAGAIDLGDWPRLLMGVSALVAGALFDLHDRSYMNITMTCTAMLSALSFFVLLVDGNGGNAFAAIAQVCGSSLWIWLAAMVGIGAWNMLIGILIACSIVSLLLIMFVAPGRPVAAHEEIHHHA